MKNKFKVVFISLILSVFLNLVFSCEWKNEEEEFGIVDCDTSEVTLSGKVQPILQSNCYACHATQSAAVAGAGVNLEEYSSLETRVNNGSLVGSITHASGFSPMPKGASKLSDCDISIIKAWIDKGALND